MVLLNRKKRDKRNLGPSYWSKNEKLSGINQYFSSSPSPFVTERWSDLCLTPIEKVGHNIPLSCVNVAWNQSAVPRNRSVTQIGAGRWNHVSWKACLLDALKTIVADVLAIQGARALAAVILTLFSRKIPSFDLHQKGEIPREPWPHKVYVSG